MVEPLAVARIGDVLLLEADTWRPRALWRSHPAASALVYASGSDGEALTSAALAIGRPDSRSTILLPVRLAGLLEGERALVVFEQPGGIALTELLATLKKNTPQKFPLDVACRLALQVASLTTWLPRVDDMVVTWEGRLRASPVPRLPGGMRDGMLSRDMRFLSPALVRGLPMDAAGDSLHCAGVLVYELLTGTVPFALESDDSSGDNVMTLLVGIMQGERIPLLRIRPDVGEALGAAVDGMVAVTSEKRTSATQARAVLGARACSDEEAATFLAGYLRETFAEERAADATFWEQALTMTDAAAPAWTLTGVAPTSDIAATLRTLNNRSSRTD